MFFRPRNTITMTNFWIMICTFINIEFSSSILGCKFASITTGCWVRSSFCWSKYICHVSKTSSSYSAVWLIVSVLEVRFHHVIVIRVNVYASQWFSAFIERDQNEDVKLKVYFAKRSVRRNQGLVRSQKCHDFLKIVETAMFMLPPKGGVEIRGAKLILARDISVRGTGTGKLRHWYFRHGSLYLANVCL